MKPNGASDEVTLAVIDAKLEHLSSTVQTVANDMRSDRQGYVTRSEWVLRNAHVDKMLGDLDHDVKSKRVPWPSIGALGVAALSIVITLAQNL